VLTGDEGDDAFKGHARRGASAARTTRRLRIPGLREDKEDHRKRRDSGENGGSEEQSRWHGRAQYIT